MKMEPIVSSETSAIRTQTLGNYPKRNKLQLCYCLYIRVLFREVSVWWTRSDDCTSWPMIWRHSVRMWPTTATTLLQCVFRQHGSIPRHAAALLSDPSQFSAHHIRSVGLSVNHRMIRNLRTLLHLWRKIPGQNPDFVPTLSNLGTAVAQWLRCCATTRNVTGSIPAGVIGIFHWIKSFRSHYGPGVDSASNRI